MRVAFHTLGCKVNSYETQAVLEQFAGAGWEIVDFTQEADVYVINTCSVTSMAEHKSRQLIHRARKKSPGAVVVAAGCYAQRAEEELLKDPGIDLVVGNNHKSEIVEIVTAYLESASRTGCISDLSRCRDYESQTITGNADRSRAYVKIQDGCNRFCSYCIIPYVRGRSRCRDEEEIFAEIRTLAENGYREIVLTGIDISMYEDMAGLLEYAETVPGIDRVRLGSLEAGVITDGFIERASACRKLCPHFHLSLQSGCNATLKRMNRHYTADEFEEKVRRLREKFPGCAITTDVIVGFPGETDEEFEESMAFVRKCAFSQTHVFKYSRREGTVADRMADQVPENIKNERSARMISMCDGMNRAFAESLIGSTKEVLIEEESVTDDGRRIMTGFTPEYIKAGTEAADVPVNSVVKLKLTELAETENGRAVIGIIQ